MLPIFVMRASSFGSEAAAVTIAGAATAQHQKIDEKEVIRYERQEITLPTFRPKVMVQLAKVEANGPRVRLRRCSPVHCPAGPG